MLATEPYPEQLDDVTALLKHAGMDLLDNSANMFLEPAPTGDGDGCENCAHLELKDKSSSAVE